MVDDRPDEVGVEIREGCTSGGGASENMGVEVASRSVISKWGAEGEETSMRGCARND